MCTDRRERILLFLLTTYCIGLYLPSLANGFAFDDRIHIEHNFQLVGWSSLFHTALSPIFPGDLFRPTTVVVNGIIQNLFLNSATVHHAVNITLHALNSLLLTQIVWKLLERFSVNITRLDTIWFGIAVGAVWTTLPIHLETVANISGRAELLSAFFGLLAINLITPFSTTVSTRTFGRQALLLFLIALSIGSKESGLLWGLVAFLLVRDWSARVAVIAAVVAVVALRFSAFGGALPGLNPTQLDNPLIALSSAERALYSFGLLGRYAVATFYPLSIAADYSWGYFLPPVTWLEIVPYLVVSLLLLGMAIISCSTLIAKKNSDGRKSPSALTVIGIGTIWFFLFFTPTCNIFFPIGTIFGERLAYAPSIGLSTALCGLLFWARIPWLTLGYCALAAPLIFTSSSYWRDNQSLFQRQIVVSPTSVKTKVNYAVILKNRGNYREASLLLHEALRALPIYAEALFNLGHISLLTGETARGKEELERALAANPNLPDTLNLLGRILLNEKNYQRADELFNRLLVLNTLSVDGHIGKVALALSVQDFASARSLLKKLDAIAPGNSEVESLKALLTAQRQ